MPSSLTGTGASFTNPIIAPADGDTRNAASVQTAFQSLIDNDKFLQLILQSTGITKIRKVTSTANLKAIAGPVEGDVAILATGGLPQVYTFRSVALAGSDIAGARYDSTTVAGYWVSPWLHIADISGASPRLDVQTLPPPNRIVQSFEVVDNAPSSVTWANGASWRATDAQTILTGIEVGDIIELTGSLVWSVDSGTEVVSVRLYRSDSGGAAAVTGSQMDDLSAIGANKLHPVTVSGRYVSTAAGSHTVTLEIYGDGGTPFNFSIHGYRTLRGRVIRP